MSAPSTEPTPNVSVAELYSLKGQSAVITGATRGIGAACAIALAQAGADICLIQRTSKPNSTSEAIIALGRKCEIVECDLEDAEKVNVIFAECLEKMGGQIHILVSCGGIQSRAPAVSFPMSEWNRVLQVNLNAVWSLAQQAGQHMVPLRRGKIVNFGSLMCFQGGLTVPAYTAAKGAVGQLTKSLSNEWAKENVQVNCLAPGYVATDMNEKLLADPTRLRQISERIPAGRWAAPADFAGPILFLCSKASQYVSGETLVVDGGWMGR